MTHQPMDAHGKPVRSLIFGTYANGQTGIYVLPGTPNLARQRLSEYLSALQAGALPASNMPARADFQILLSLGVSEVKEWYYVLSGEEDVNTPDEPALYQNWYRHCGIEWCSEWSCQCNDRCPRCNAEIEPYVSLDMREESA